MIRVGVPIASLARQGGYPWLVSANALYNHKKQEFRDPHQFCHYGTALDSAGFVAMARYGGYPWTADEYVRLGALNPWDWWASMDFCCEPELGKEARVRVQRTATALSYLRSEVMQWRDEGADNATMPMPVIQGWLPEHYLESVNLTAEALDGSWPELIGIGSMCRRRMKPAVEIFHLVARQVPPTTKIHLFGVKSAALRQVHTHPQFGSIDSCAYDFDARMKACKGNFSNTLDHRRKIMREWVTRQENATRQLGLFNENSPRITRKPKKTSLRKRTHKRSSHTGLERSHLSGMQKINLVAIKKMREKRTP